MAPQLKHFPSDFSGLRWRLVHWAPLRQPPSDSKNRQGLCPGSPLLPFPLASGFALAFTLALALAL
eukprot:6296702-Pyramimonas_sp.AAC.2